jgi:16S rRNA (guanine966-N2)-methyltransferase
MRIIAGKHKSRKLVALEGLNTRPMMDKMKETIFNIIGPYFTGDIVLDLFGGSGALSLEAISRGAAHANIVEVSKDAIRIIKENIASLREEDTTTLYNLDYQLALNIFAREHKKFNLIFLDPPYRLNIMKEIIDFIITNDLLAKEGIIVCQYVRNNYLPQETEILEIRKNFNYASSEVCIYQKKEV